MNQHNRRQFVSGSAAALAGGTLVGASTASLAANKRPLIIDCHAHIYGLDEKKYPTIPKPYRPPAGKGTVSHLKNEMIQAGVRYATAIQTSTFYRFDNRFTADSARANKSVMAAVVTLNPDDERSPGMLKNYVLNYNTRGMRSIAAKSGKLDDPGVDRLWTMAEKLGIVINVLTGRDKRPEIERLVKRHPKLRVIIDHCFNLRPGPTLKPTLDDMARLAELPNVHAKLTFIPTGSGKKYPCDDLFDACRAVVKAFGANRCVWGSDFPCELWCPKVSYGQHLKIFTDHLGFSDKQKEHILGKTAYRLWFQPRRQ